MAKFDIRKTSRKCSASGRAFEPGEEFYSIVSEAPDGQLVREDFSIEAWEKEPEDCIGWWKARMPDNRGGRVYWAPTRVQLALFEFTLNRPGSEDVAYVMSIVLMRNRTLKLIDTDEENEPPVMTCHHRATKTNYKVPVVDVAAVRIAEIQEELAEQLFTDSRDSGDDEDEDDDDAGDDDNNQDDSGSDA